MEMAIAETIRLAGERDDFVARVWGGRGPFGIDRLRMASGRHDDLEARCLAVAKAQAAWLKRLRRVQHSRGVIKARAQAATEFLAQQMASDEHDAGAACTCAHLHCVVGASADDVAESCRWLVAVGQPDLRVPCADGRQSHELADVRCFCPHFHCRKCGAAVRAEEPNPEAWSIDRLYVFVDDVKPAFHSAHNEVLGRICGYCRSEERARASR